MKKVILTIGPQGAGKSTYCERYCIEHPDTILISRDQILIEMFGTVWLNGYSGGHLLAKEQIWKQLETAIQVPDCTIILDCWNCALDRILMVEHIKTLGVDRLIAWYFTTPAPVACQWFLDREGEGHSERFLAIKKELYHDTWENYHNHARNLEVLFDEVVHIDPSQEVVLEKSL